MRTTAWLTPTLALALLAAPGLAQADEVHLNNGRVLVGKVVGEHDGKLTLEVAGGTFSFPASEVARIEEKQTPQEQFAELSQGVDMNDPAQVARLAEWATRNRLGEQARQLQEMVRGLELQRRVDGARAREGAEGFLAVAAWAAELGYSLEVRRWLAEQAYAADPEHEEARRALHRIELEEQQLAAAEVATAEAATAEAVEAEVSRPLTPQERLRAEQLDALREQLERQRDATDALRERLRQLEDQRQQTAVPRRRRRHRRAVAAAPGPKDCPQARRLAPIMRGPLLRPTRLSRSPQQACETTDGADAAK